MSNHNIDDAAEVEINASGAVATTSFAFKGRHTHTLTQLLLWQLLDIG